MAKRKNLSEHATLLAEAIGVIMKAPVKTVEEALRECLPLVCEPGWTMPPDLVQAAERAKVDEAERSLLFSALVNLGVAQHQVKGEDPLLAVIQRKCIEDRNRKLGRRR